MSSKFAARVVAVSAIVRRAGGVRLHSWTKHGDPVTQNNRNTVPAGVEFVIEDRAEFERLLESGAIEEARP